MTPLRRGWFHLASGAGVGRILGFGSNLLLSRWLGPTELGLFNLVTTTIQTSDTLARCGGDYALNYEVGGKAKALQTRYGSELARGFVQVCSLTTLIICLFVFIWIWLAHGLFPYPTAISSRANMTLLLLLMIACETCCASGWEILLASNQTLKVSLKNGIFVPFRLLAAALGSYSLGTIGAMFGWTLISLFQCLWMRNALRENWNPFCIWPLLGTSIWILLRKGIPFYSANLLGSAIFYSLLIKVSNDSGLADIGYLRVGQILQQLFAFLPATLVPILFLKLRQITTFKDQVLLIEKPFRIIWFVLLQILLLYCLFDNILISRLFGASFDSALLPTRLLLLTALFECLAQLLVQPLLAAGKMRLYGACQNISAVTAGFLGWLWIPSAGLAAYLIVRLVHVILPLIGFGIPVIRHLEAPSKIFALAIISCILPLIFLYNTFALYPVAFDIPIFTTAIVISLALYRHDALYLVRLIQSRA